MSNLIGSDPKASVREHYRLEVEALFEAMDASIKIERVTFVSLGAVKWSPQTCFIGDEECVELCPGDYGLVSLVAAAAGMDLKACSKRRPSLTCVPGFVELKELRDKAQADELRGAGPSKSMFADAEEEEGATRARKRKKATKMSMAERRENPEIFTFLADGMPIEAQRPIQRRDKIVVKLNEASLENAVKFIASRGVSEDDLFLKRGYRTTGQKGVWSFARGAYTYKKTGEGFEKVAKEEVDAAVGDEALGPEGEHELHVLGEVALPSPMPSEASEEEGSQAVGSAASEQDMEEGREAAAAVPEVDL